MESVEVEVIMLVDIISKYFSYCFDEMKAEYTFFPLYEDSFHVTASESFGSQIYTATHVRTTNLAI